MMIKKPWLYVKLAIYCFFMRRLWKLGYRLFNWAEDRRPGDGFRVKSYWRRFY